MYRRPLFIALLSLSASLSTANCFAGADYQAGRYVADNASGYSQPGLSTPGYYSPRPNYLPPPPRYTPDPPQPDYHPAQSSDPRYQGVPGSRRGPPLEYERQYDGHYGAGGGRGAWDR